MDRPRAPELDFVVVGGGVIGLACAAQLAALGRSVVVLERGERCGAEVSSRNSGVVHAGLYYPEDSLKAQLCIRGRALLYELAERHNIGFAKTGKLVVATRPAEQLRLEQLFAQGAALGVPLRWMGAAEVSQMEPHISAQSALFSPESGIVDVHGLVYFLQKSAKDHGAVIAKSTEVCGLDRTKSGWRIKARQRDGSVVTLRSHALINAAGLGAPQIAAQSGVDIEKMRYKYHLCKGEYFALCGKWRRAVSHLVYPVPVHAGLGIHLTVNLQGDVTAGPDATYKSAPDYDVAPSKAAVFAEALGRYLPGITSSDLSPSYAGVRPKLQGPEDPFVDFVIDVIDDSQVVHLVGIESPGLTASLAIAEHVRKKVLMWF